MTIFLSNRESFALYVIPIYILLITLFCDLELAMNKQSG